MPATKKKLVNFSQPPKHMLNKCLALSRSIAALANVFMINFLGPDSETLKVFPNATMSIAFSAGSFFVDVNSMSLTSLMLRALRTTARPTVTRSLKRQLWNEESRKHDDGVSLNKFHSIHVWLNLWSLKVLRCLYLLNGQEQPNNDP